MKRFFIVALSAFIITAILTWPLLPNITSYYTDYGDYPVIGFNLWYNYDSLVTGRMFNQTQYFNGLEAYPHPYTLAYGSNLVVPSAIFFPFYLITHSLPFSVNMVTFLSFFLSLVIAFYSIRILFRCHPELVSGSPFQTDLACFIGAAIYAFNPTSMGRFPEHLDLLSKYMLPPLFVTAFLFFDKPTKKRGILFALFFLLNSLTANYYFIFSLIALPLLALYPVILNLFQDLRKKQWNYFLNFLKYGSFLLLTLPILFYFLYPYQQFSTQEGAVRDISATVFFAARGIDFISNPPNSLLYGGVYQALLDQRAPKDSNGVLNTEEHSLSLNILPTILLLIGLFVILKAKPEGSSQRLNKQDSSAMPHNDIKWYFIGLLIFSLIMMLGSSFVGWNSPTGSFPMPYDFFYQFIPVVRGLRVPARFEFLAYVSVSIFAAFGALYLFEKFKKQAWILFGISIAFLILENFTINNFSDRSLALAQAHQTGLPNLRGKATVHLPIFVPDQGKESAYLNFATVTGEKLMNYNNGYLPPDQAQFVMDLKKGLTPEMYKELKAIGVNYIISHKGQKVTVQNIDAMNITIKICNFNTDFDKSVHTGELQDFSQSFNVLVLQNKSDCYLPSLYQDRYRTLTLDIDGQKQPVHLRLPLVIDPYEKVVLSEYDNTLRLDSN